MAKRKGRGRTKASEGTVIRDASVQPEAHARMEEIFRGGKHDLDLSDLSDLEQLPNLDGLQDKLRTLSISNTQIVHIPPLSEFTQLQTVNLSNSGIYSLLSIRFPIGLRHLYLSDTKITDIAPIRRLTRLETLDLDRTEIKNLEAICAMQGLQRAAAKDPGAGLSFVGCPISDRELVEISKLPNPARTVQALRHIRKLEYIELSHRDNYMLPELDGVEFEDVIVTFTPKGNFIALPSGATTIDFAYAIHKDLGTHTVGAKIFGSHVPLHTPLQSGDEVEIIRTDETHPTPNWLGFVKTRNAREAITEHLNRIGLNTTITAKQLLKALRADPYGAQSQVIGDQFSLVLASAIVDEHFLSGSASEILFGEIIRKAKSLHSISGPLSKSAWVG